MLQVNEAAEEERAQQMANLTTQNQDLQQHITALVTQMSTIQSLLQQLTNASHQQGTSTPKGKKAKGNKKPVACCWTHGGTFNIAHTSQKCKTPASKHDREATSQEIRGGCQKWL